MIQQIINQQPDSESKSSLLSFHECHQDIFWGMGGQPENLFAGLHTSLERGLGLNLLDFYQTTHPKKIVLNYKS
jgi:hypothetical protein